MGKEVTVQAGNRRVIQARKPVPRAFDAAKRQVFLDGLAGCSNMTQAAAAAGVSLSTVNCHRRRDEAFAAQVADALEVGYDLLLAAAMERAATGGGGYRPGPDAATAPGPDSVDTALVLNLLALRRKGGGSPTKQPGRRTQRVSERALNEAIVAKLALLDQRMKAGRPLGFKGRKGTLAKRSGAKGMGA